jgi:hypothetical protein
LDLDLVVLDILIFSLVLPPAGQIDQVLRILIDELLNVIEEIH